MNTATEAQIKFITDLANRILAVDVSKLPTAEKNKFTKIVCNIQQNAKEAQKIAADKLAMIAADGLTKIGASNAIEELKIQARRARA